MGSPARAMPDTTTEEKASMPESQAARPVLSLVVPVFNEGPHLRRWCELMFGLDFGVPVEFVFVDDCSTDDSRTILLDYKDRPNVRIFKQEMNQGKGAAVARGIRETRGDVVLIQDADFEYSPKDIPAVIAPILEDDADVVFGSRYKGSFTVHRTFHYAVNRFLTTFSNLASGLYLTDMETCYKAFRGEIIRNIQIESPRFGVEPELTAKVAALKVRVSEVPIRYSPRTYLEGKKIKWTDGVAAMWMIVKFNASQKKLRDALRDVPEKYKVNGRQWL
jgi:glycosyltransferase involved in cell wall biosynthesis